MVRLCADELMLEGLKKVHRGKMFLTYNIIVTYIYTDDLFLVYIAVIISLYKFPYFHVSFIHKMDTKYHVWLPFPSIMYPPPATMPGSLAGCEVHL